MTVAKISYRDSNYILYSSWGAPSVQTRMKCGQIVDDWECRQHPTVGGEMVGGGGESKKQFMKSTIFWGVKICSSVKFIYVSEKRIDSIFTIGKIHPPGKASFADYFSWPPLPKRHVLSELRGFTTQLQRWHINILLRSSTPTVPRNYQMCSCQQSDASPH
jgi:hypothetical protein